MCNVNMNFNRKKIQVCVSVLIFVCVTLTLAVTLTLLLTQHDPTPNSMGYKKAAVAADTQICSTVGKEILLQGGNAVDAAIATLLCTGLASPQSMGIGGGFFMTIYNKSSGIATVIDARETAPTLTSIEMFTEKSTFKRGPLSIAVPGEIQGYWYAHQKYGKLPWAEVFRPAIRMAENGFPVPPNLHKAMVGSRQDVLKHLKDLFWNSATGDLYKEGEIIKYPKIGETLKVIAREGAPTFYHGTLSDLIIQDLKELGSVITHEDLRNYTVLEKKPVVINLSNGMTVLTSPAPTCGPMMALIFNILDGYKFTPKHVATLEGRVQTYHRIIEAFKFAYAKRTGLADDVFVDVRQLVETLTSRDYADSLRGRINDSRTYDYTYYGPAFESGSANGTSHLSVFDKDGNAVSATSTINTRFGSYRAGKRTGIIFNNEIDDFSFPSTTNEWRIAPSPANYIAPGKRPLSSMCPVVITDRHGSVSKVIGAAGGSLIPSAIVWVTSHLLWFGESLHQAVSQPRLHHQLIPHLVAYERGFDEDVLQGLITLGHNVTEFPIISAVQAIDVNSRDGAIVAESDVRRKGKPDGY
ncbi:gamma-glutamyltranspeptidase 1 [Biomphalaria glabrata]|nr:gamma-glutamyltranspeptidase 1 [Biomphalaria glabrata]